MLPAHPAWISALSWACGPDLLGNLRQPQMASSPIILATGASDGSARIYILNPHALAAAPNLSATFPEKGAEGAKLPERMQSNARSAFFVEAESELWGADGRPVTCIAARASSKDAAG